MIRLEPVFCEEMNAFQIGELESSAYRPPIGLGNGHLQSVYPTLFRKLPAPVYQRRTIPTPDGDEILIDLLSAPHSNRCVVISHGLGGHSRRQYVVGMAHIFLRAGWNVVAWNFRGSVGSPMHRPVFTHNGAIEDLAAVINALPGMMEMPPTRIGLVGFSMGANLSLLYLGRKAAELPKGICGAVAFSVPCDLPATSRQMAHWSNRIYMRRFLIQLKEMLAPVAARFPERVSLEHYEEIRDFSDFDNRYTAPLHGFSDAIDYWTRCSSLHVLDRIQTPALIVNAQNDPFLTPSCFPHAVCAANPALRLLAPRSGGHCGFIEFCDDHVYWSERIASRFLAQCADRYSE